MALPDHMHYLHCVIELPHAEFDFASRWRLNLTRFSKLIPQTESRYFVRVSFGERYGIDRSAIFQNPTIRSVVMSSRSQIFVRWRWDLFVTSKLRMRTTALRNSWIYFWSQIAKDKPSDNTPWYHNLITQQLIHIQSFHATAALALIFAVTPFAVNIHHILWYFTLRFRLAR